jgi:hypothetical protein
MGIVTRNDAKNMKLKFYCTGIPCKHGHVANRYTSNNICTECQSRSNRQHWDENRDELVQAHQRRLVEHGDRYNHNRRVRYAGDEVFRDRIKQYASDWYMDNREAILSSEDRKQQQQKYQHKNRDHIREVSKQWRNNNKQHVNQYARQYQKLNRPYYNAKQAAYRAQKRLATPGWCEHNAIILLYRESRQISQTTGVSHHVDHIVPLVHPKVCGLHCLANLRIITEYDNKTKNNKFTVD